MIERGYQFRFFLRLSAIIALGAVLLYLAFLLIFSRPLDGEYASIYYALRHLMEFLVPSIAFSVLAYVLVVCGAMAALCVYALHKIAGPIYRMERAFDNFVSGEPVKAVFFRHADQISALASAFNGFVGRLREDRKGWLEVMEHADRLCLQDPVTCRAEMEKALDELETLLSRYR